MIRIQVFSDVFLSYKFLTSDLPERDSIIGFDLIKKFLKKWIFIYPDGLQFAQYFLPWSIMNCYISLVKGIPPRPLP